MPLAKRDGLRLYYKQEGSGEPPIVFVHGWCCDHTYFEPQFDHFKASHSVMALDLQGCGRSHGSSNGCDLRTFADDVAWLCHELGLSTPVVVGHSLGGAIAIELGTRHPSLPAAVVAVDPAPIDPPSEVRDTLNSLVVQLRGPDAEAACRAFVEDSMFIEADDSERKRRITDQMCSAPMDVAAAVLASIANWDGGEALKACAVPTLILLADVGENDPARLRALKPDVHIGVTVGAGHFHHLEVPQQVTPMIERFMRVAVRSTLEPA